MSEGQEGKRAEIAELLDQLAELEAQRDVIRLEKQELCDKVVPLEIRQQLADIEAEYADREAAVAERIQDVTNRVKAAVLAHGETVKGGRRIAVWCNGRVTWDSAGLDRLAAQVPQVLLFRKQGEPTVTIRKV